METHETLSLFVWSVLITYLHVFYGPENNEKFEVNSLSYNKFMLNEHDNGINAEHLPKCFLKLQEE